MPSPFLRSVLFLLLISSHAAGQGPCVPPVITQQPQGQTVSSGQSITLTVAATGTAPLVYRWLELRGNASVAVGANSAQFTTPAVFFPTTYLVLVSNACGSVNSFTAVLTLAGAPPNPSAYRVGNSASGFLSGENGYGIAPGSLFVLYGDNLGPVALQQANSFPIPATLAGTSIQVNMGGATYNAPMIYSSFRQVAAILPSAVPPGEGTLTVRYNGAASFPLNIHVVKGAFGIFTLTSNGAGAGVIHDAASRLLTFAQPAHPGDTVVIWGTGLGAVTGLDVAQEAAAPQPGNRFTPEVFVGNRPAPVQYAGRSGCCVGLDQIVIQIPAGVQGCFVPMAVRTNGIVSNFASLPVGLEGNPCSDAVGVPIELTSKAATRPGVNLGIIAIGPIPALQNAGFSFLEGLSERLSALLGTKVTEKDLRTLVRASGGHRGRALRVVLKKYAPLLRARHLDPAAIVNTANALNYEGASVGFRTFTGSSGFTSQFTSALPPPGTCTAGSDFSFSDASFGAASIVRDAGPQMLLTGPGGSQMLRRLSNGDYQLPIGPGSNNFGLPAGTYSISSIGGREIGAFNATLQTAEKLTWTNKANVGFIDRSKPLTVTWSGGNPSGYVVFGGASSSSRPSAFLCVEEARKETLTVPDYVLSAIPPASSDHGSAFLTAHPLQNLFTAPGLDIGFFADLSSDSKELGFQ